jgi:hypothetical protein
MGTTTRMSVERKNGRGGSRTLAELLFYMPTAALRQQLELFRIQYESEHGPTDLTKRYTCTWKSDEQKWLCEHHPKEYFDGLPPFVKEFTRQHLVQQAQAGALDNESPMLIRLFVSGHINNNGNRDR